MGNWNPGHYIGLGRNHEEYTKITNEPNIKGALLIYHWDELEPTEGNYDFTAVQAKINQLKALGKRTILQVRTKSFNKNIPAVPDYVVSGVAGGNTHATSGVVVGAANNVNVGAMWQYSTFDSSPWVTDLIDNLLSAMSSSLFNKDWLEGIMFEESGLSLTAAERPADCTATNWLDALKRVNLSIKSHFPDQVVWQGVNYILGGQSTMDALTLWCSQNGIGLSQPDLQIATDAEQAYQDNAGIIPLAHQNQVTKLGVYLKIGGNSYQTLYTRALAINLNHMIWTRHNAWTYTWASGSVTVTFNVDGNESDPDLHIMDVVDARIAAGNNLATTLPSAIGGTPGGGGDEPTPLYVNCQGDQLVDSDDITWRADFGFNGGGADSTSDVITLTDPNAANSQALYQDIRIGLLSESNSFTYTFDLASGTYDVRLHFIEPFYTANGSRVFDFEIKDGATSRIDTNNFDIHAEAGHDIALVKEYTSLSITSGAINIEFTQGTDDRPVISAIEIFESDVSGSGGTFTKRIVASTDDSEENSGSGSVNVSSADLELNQYLLLRYTECPVENGDSIGSGAIELTAAASESDSTSVTIYGVLDPDPGTGTTTNSDISDRTLTTANVAWSPGAWTAGSTYTTPDLSTILQEIVNQASYAANNAIAFVFVPSTGKRTAYSYDNLAANSPQISVTFGPDTTNPTAPTVLASSNITEVGFDLSWTNGSDASGIGGTYIYIDSVLHQTLVGVGTSVTVTGLTSGETYTVEVSHYDASSNNNESVKSSSISVAVGDVTAPTVPSELEARVLTIDKIQLQWNGSTDAGVGVSKYKIYKDGIYLGEVTDDELAYTVSGLAADVLKEYKITAEDGNTNESGYSVAINFAPVINRARGGLSGGMSNMTGGMNG